MRCPNGTRKDKNGNCVKKSTSNEMKNNTKRCPKGSHKNKSGDCIKHNTTKKKKSSEIKIPSEKKLSEIKIPSEKKLSEIKIPSEKKSSEIKIPSEKKSSEIKIPSEKKSSETKTPRSIYAKRYFANNKQTIHLLDKLNDSNKSVLVQVKYNDVEQFTNYRNLANNPSSDCFFQTLFSLGMRDVKIAKQESIKANTTSSGPNIGEMMMFIKNAFNLSKQERVSRRFINLTNETMKVNTDRNKINNKIVKIIDPKIKNGYAAPIFIERYFKKTGGRYGHSMVAYKHNDKLYFFDPQKHFSYVTKGNIFTSTDLFEVSGSDITQFGYYTVSNLEHPKPLMDTTCKITF